jgi:hypothetical protein
VAEDSSSVVLGGGGAQTSSWRLGLRRTVATTLSYTNSKSRADDRVGSNAVRIRNTRCIVHPKRSSARDVKKTTSALMNSLGGAAPPDAARAALPASRERSEPAMADLSVVYWASSALDRDDIDARTGCGDHACVRVSALGLRGASACKSHRMGNEQ